MPPSSADLLLAGLDLGPNSSAGSQSSRAPPPFSFPSSPLSTQFPSECTSIDPVHHRIVHVVAPRLDSVSVLAHAGAAVAFPLLGARRQGLQVAAGPKTVVAHSAWGTTTGKGRGGGARQLLKLGPPPCGSLTHQEDGHHQPKEKLLHLLGMLWSMGAVGCEVEKVGDEEWVCSKRRSRRHQHASSQVARRQQDKGKGAIRQVAEESKQGGQQQQQATSATRGAGLMTDHLYSHGQPSMPSNFRSISTSGDDVFGKTPTFSATDLSCSATISALPSNTHCTVNAI